MKNVFSEDEGQYRIYRPELDRFPPVALPVFPRSTGYYCRPPGYEEHVPAGEKNFVQIFWCTAGEGRVTVGTEKFRMQSGDVFYRLPNQEHHLLTSEVGWKYRWITFDGPRAGWFMRSYGYPPEPFHAGDCPQESFLHFKTMMLQRTPYCWRLMFAEICRILAAAGGANDEPTEANRLVLQVVSLCKERFDDPDLNVNALAAELDIGRGALLGVFKQKMNQTLSDYLSQVRLQAALTLLRNSRRPLREVAAACGFRDLNYFCRFVKRLTGRRPSDLR